jgi:hypothetical protein
MPPSEDQSPERLKTKNISTRRITTSALTLLRIFSLCGFVALRLLRLALPVPHGPTFRWDGRIVDPAKWFPLET